MRTRFLFLLIVAVFSYTVSFGQVRNEAAQSFQSDKYSLGIGVGFATMYGDLNQHQFTPGFRIGIGRHITKSLIVGFEGYFGNIGSTEATNAWSKGLRTNAVYQAIDFNGKTSLGQLFQYTENPLGKALSACYIGVGAGMINVHTNVQYDYVKVSGLVDEQVAKRYFRDHDLQPYIALNIGFRVHMKNFLGTKSTQIMVNYNNNYTFSDYLDGINFTTATATNKYKDVYSVLTVGFSFLLTSRQKEL